MIIVNKLQSLTRPRRAGAGGFTLIELMITVLVIAVLAAIAYASYQFAVTKSRRSAAATCLQERAQFMERWHSTNMTYVGGLDPMEQCPTEIVPFYTVSFSVAPSAAAPNTYTLTAVPQGRQAANDTLCATLSLNSQGLRGESGTATNATECW